MIAKDMARVMVDVVNEQADRIAELEKQKKPLSDEEIIAIRDSCYVQSGIDEWEFDDVNFARAIEKRHGIK